MDDGHPSSECIGPVHSGMPSLWDRKFICRACRVPEPEERFAIDEYSDMVAVAKPMVYVTVGELTSTHRVRGSTGGLGWKSTQNPDPPLLPNQAWLSPAPLPFSHPQLLLEHQDQLAPGHQDPLHQLLEDLGEPPTIADLIGVCLFGFWSLQGWLSAGSWLIPSLVP